MAREVLDCDTCKNRRHLATPEGFVPCPSCYIATQVAHGIRSRGLPAAWIHCAPEAVIPMFGEQPRVGPALSGLLDGTLNLVHAYGLPSPRRQAFVGALAYGFIRAGQGIQILDTGMLAAQSFAKEGNTWPQTLRDRHPVVLTMGREVEVRMAMIYFRALMERAVGHQLPFVLLTDYPLSTHGPRYADLTAVIESAGFDLLDVAIS